MSKNATTSSAQPEAGTAPPPRGNLRQVDDYFRELVRERGLASILLVDDEGRRLGTLIVDYDLRAQ